MCLSRRSSGTAFAVTVVALVSALVVGCGASQEKPPMDGSVSGTGGTGGGGTGGAHHDAAIDASSHDASLPDASGDASDVVSCDRRPLSCRVAEPVCGEGEVPRIIGNCFGECVRIDECVCSEAAECPFEEMYTCHRFRQRCGPYVN